MNAIIEPRRENLQIGTGLLILPPDERDFDLGGVFGKADLPPDIDFVVSNPLAIKDQKSSSMCVAFALVAVSEDQEGVELSPEWFYSQIKRIEGDYSTWGSDYRTALKTAVKYGFLEQRNANFSLTDKSQEFLANWANWRSELNDLALIHKKQSFFRIKKDGYNDYFDAIRSYLWKFKDKKQSIATGLEWCDEWTNAEGGVINTNGIPSYGHAFKIFGQQFIDGEPYLIVQLSNGTDIGDRGLYYLSREIINQVEKYGAFMLVDLDSAYAKFLNKKGLTIKWLFLAKLVNLIKNYFGEFII